MRTILNYANQTIGKITSEFLFDCRLKVVDTDKVKDISVNTTSHYIIVTKAEDSINTNVSVALTEDEVDVEVIKTIHDDSNAKSFVFQVADETILDSFTMTSSF